MAKINKLNSGAILSQYSKEFTQKSLTLDVGGKNYQVLIDEKFKTSQIQKMILESLKNMEKLKDVDEATKTSYYMLLMIKYFTDTGIPEDFEEQIRVLSAMIDIDIFGKIIDAFNESEIKRASEFINKFAERLTEMTKENKSAEEMKELIEAEIKDEDVVTVEE